MAKLGLNIVTNALQDSRKRFIFIIMGIIVSIAIVILAVRWFGNTTDASAQVTSIPAEIQSVPGSASEQQNQKYLQTLLASNQQAAQQALRSGQSEIPTLIASPDTNQGGQFTAGNSEGTAPPCCCPAGGAPNDADGAIGKLEAAGSISPMLAGQLRQLQAERMGLQDYMNRLAQLKNQGELTGAEEQALEKAYRESLGANQPIAERGAGSALTPDQLVSTMLQNKKLTPSAAAAVTALNAEGLTPDEYADQLKALAAKQDLSQAQLQQLLGAYKRNLEKAQTTPNSLVEKLARSGSISPETASHLEQLGNSQETPEAYRKALTGLTQEGKLTPAQAKQLVTAFEAQPAGAGEGADSSLKTLIAAQNAALAAKETASSNGEVSDDTDSEGGYVDQQAQQAMQQEVQNLQSAFVDQAKALTDSWHAPTQRMVGELVALPAKLSGAVSSGASGGRTAAGHRPESPSKSNLAKAGDIWFAVLDTSLNSDQPGPILATVVNGPYSGAKLIGSLAVTSDYEAVTLTFTQMSLPDWPETININAIAIDPDTARTALASGVDHHYLLRYGSLFAASFIQGIGSAVQNSGSTSVNNSGTTSQTFSNLNAGDKVLVGLGQVGQSFGSAAQQLFSTKNTITVNSGTGMGILFTKNIPTPGFLNSDNSSTTSTTQESSDGSGST